MRTLPIEIVNLQNALDRFWVKTEVTPDGCWKWLGSINSAGYAVMRVEGRVVLAHRFAYAAVRFGSGEVQRPGEVLDHACHERTCVNPSHVRSVSPAVNCRNRAGANTGSITGVRNVCWIKKLGKFRVAIGLDRKTHHIGLFSTLEEATVAAEAARLRYFGEGVQTQVAA